MRGGRSEEIEGFYPSGQGDTSEGSTGNTPSTVLNPVLKNKWKNRENHSILVELPSLNPFNLKSKLTRHQIYWKKL